MNAYFDSNASYWDGVYTGEDLQGRIYQRRQDAVLEFVAASAVAGGSRVLEIGCGAGRLTEQLAKREFLVDAVDASQAMVDSTAARVRDAGLSDRVSVQQADVHALAYPDGHFDLVVAVGVIPWLHSPEAGVAEMARVLKRGSSAVLTADNRARLTSFTDPRRIVGMSALKPLYRKLRGHDQPDMSRLHWPRRVDRMLLAAGLEPQARRTLGFGPLSFMGRAVLEGRAGARLDARLQTLADRGAPGLQWTGWHYLVRATKGGA